MDKTIQTSAAFYDPSIQVIVFVFLPSKSGNSVAMWRRKIRVPNNTRLSLQPEINMAMAGLRKEKDYHIHVDEYVPPYCHHDDISLILGPVESHPIRRNQRKRSPHQHLPRNPKRKSGGGIPSNGDFDQIYLVHIYFCCYRYAFLVHALYLPFASIILVDYAVAFRHI